MNFANLHRFESTSSSDEFAEQTSALLKTGGDPRLIVALRALRNSWELNSLERAQQNAHKRAVEAGIVTELFPLQSETQSITEDSNEPEMRHVRILLPNTVKVELFDQDSEII